MEKEPGAHCASPAAAAEWLNLQREALSTARLSAAMIVTAFCGVVETAKTAKTKVWGTLWGGTTALRLIARAEGFQHGDAGNGYIAQTRAIHRIEGNARLPVSRMWRSLMRMFSKSSSDSVPSLMALQEVLSLPLLAGNQTASQKRRGRTQKRTPFNLAHKFPSP